MAGIPSATPIVLTADELSELEGLSRSTKSEARMRFRSQIVLLAASGAGTREIGRRVGCTTGTASKWRVRYARDRLAGLDETGNRGAEPKYGPDDDERVLAMLDCPPPAGHANWTAPLLSRAVGDIHEHTSGVPARPEDRPVAPQVLVSEQRPEVRRQGGRGRRLYMAPPDNAVVLSIDEKPSIQALAFIEGYNERARPFAWKAAKVHQKHLGTRVTYP